MGKINALTRLENIEFSISIGEHRKATKDLNSLDDNMSNAMKLAEQHCGRRQKTTPWSPQLREWGRKVRFWRKRLHIRTKGHRPTMDLFHIAKEYDLPHPFHQVPIQEIRKKLEEACEKLKEVRAHAAEYCRQHLIDRAEAMAKAGIMDKEAAIKCILRAEEFRQKEARLKAIFKPRSSRALTSLLVPDPKDNTKPPEERRWIWIQNGEEIDAALIEYNRRHFSQARNTPFAQGTLADLLGVDSCTKLGQDILAGKATVDLAGHPVQEEIQAVIQAFKQPDEIKSHDPIPHLITVGEFVAGMKAWDKRTTTSPSSHHLGHYKALIAPDGHTGDEDIFDPASAILQFHTRMINAAIQLGQPLRRWIRSNRCMLEKDQGNPRITRLRVIQIYKADFNLIQKIQWSVCPGVRAIRVETPSFSTGSGGKEILYLPPDQNDQSRTGDVQLRRKRML